MSDRVGLFDWCRFVVSWILIEGFVGIVCRVVWNNCIVFWCCLFFWNSILSLYWEGVNLGVVRMICSNLVIVVF